MKTSRNHLSDPEAGAITILVVLMLLVLLTIAAVGMSKNSFREIVLSGTARQGGMARNVADSGIEWGIYWLEGKNSQSSSITTEAKTFNQLQMNLLMDLTKAGQPYDITQSTATAYTPGANTAVTLPTSSTLTGTTQAFSAGLTYMGQIDTTDSSQGTGPNGNAPAMGLFKGPYLWALRSDAQVSVGAVTFNHAKEAWITTPLKVVNP